MPTLITGVDGFSHQQNAPATGDPGEPSDIQAIVQRLLDNDTWTASRLGDRSVVDQITDVDVQDASSGYSVQETVSLTTWTDTGTYVQSLTVAIGDIVISRFVGTLEFTGSSPDFGEARLRIDDGTGPFISPHIRTFNEAPISIAVHRPVSDTSVAVAVQLRVSNASSARLLGAGNLQSIVLRPIADPLP